MEPLKSDWQEPTDEPRVTVLSELSEGQDPKYYFFVDGEMRLITCERQQEDRAIPYYTYRFKFYDWEFGSADVQADPDTVFLEWAGVTEDESGMAALQAAHLLEESMDYLLAAVNHDFPDSQYLDIYGNPL